MERAALVVGYTWVDGGVRLRTWEGRAAVARELAGLLSFRVEPGRWCTGLHDGEGTVPCPRAAPADRGGSCRDCAARDAWRPCLTCEGFRCPPLAPAMLARCRGTHHLYLASFGDREIKVGTASEARRIQRIVEQGPVAAALVASGEGPRVRQLETRLVAAGFSEAMRRSRKTQLLRGSAPEPEVRARVLEAAARLREVLPAGDHALLHPPELVPQPELAARSRGLPIHELAAEEGRVVQGEVVGAVGHLLFLRDGDGTFALDLGGLKGRRIAWDPAGPRRRATAQLGLF